MMNGNGRDRRVEASVWTGENVNGRRERARGLPGAERSGEEKAEVEALRVHDGHRGLSLSLEGGPVIFEARDRVEYALDDACPLDPEIVGLEEP